MRLISKHVSRLKQLSLQKGIDVPRKLVVFSRHHTASIVRVQFDPHVTECIHHRGVMGMRFGKERHPRHEGKRFLEVLETKFSDQSVVSFCPHEPAYLRPMYTKKGGETPRPFLWSE